MEQIWDDFANDPEVWVAILTGAGERAFCAGSDIKYMAAHPESRIPPRPQEGGLVRKHIWKPIIAAVKGYCVGGGLEIALNCDIIIAGENAQFGLPEIKNTGGIPGDGGPLRLPRQIPFRVAMELLLMGDFISAQRAYELGLVNRVVPVAEVMNEAEKIAERITSVCPPTVRLSKELVWRSLDMPLEFAYEKPMIAWDLYQEFGRRLRATEDYKSGEGPRSFAEKRRPRWTGR
jgi:crotonobetainyl-CoA hydratase